MSKPTVDATPCLLMLYPTGACGSCESSQATMKNGCAFRLGALSSENSQIFIKFLLKIDAQQMDLSLNPPPVCVNPPPIRGIAAPGPHQLLQAFPCRSARWGNVPLLSSGVLFALYSVEKVLFESFGDLLKEVQEVRDGIPAVTVGVRHARACSRTIMMMKISLFGQLGL
jgi:hypothetical protein